MSYKSRVRSLQEQKELNNRVSSYWQGEADSPYLRLEAARKSSMSAYYDREIERLTPLAIKELIFESLGEIGYNVTLNGEKITDAIVSQITRGLQKK